MGEAPWVSCLLEEGREKEESVYRLFTVRQTQHMESDFRDGSCRV